MTVVKGDYLIVIKFVGVNQARFITAYQNLEDGNLEKVKNSPNWEDSGGWIKNER